MSPKRTGRLFTRLYGGFLAVALTGLIFAGVLVDRNVASMARAQAEERLSYVATMLGQMCASALFGPVDASDASLGREIAELGQSVHTQLFLLTTDGKVVVDSDAADMTPPEGPTGAEANEPEIAQARRASVGIAVRGAGSNRKLYVARSIERDGKVLGFARAAFPMDVIEASIVAVRLRFAIGAAAAVAIALILGFFISLRIVRPVKTLAEGARRIGAGHYDQHIALTTRDELADLARAFNEMARDLSAAMENLRRRNQDLRLVFDNVNQGFITADAAGVLSSERSAILDSWFGTPGDKALVWDYLGAHDGGCRDWLRLSWEAISEDVLPLEMALDQLPKRIEQTTPPPSEPLRNNRRSGTSTPPGVSQGLQGRTFDLVYIPIRTAGKLSAILIVVTDVTSELERERAANDQLESIAIFKNATADRAGFADFLMEGGALIRSAVRSEAAATEIRRALHTLKGACASMGISTMVSTCHALETDLAEVPSADVLERLRQLERHWQRLVATAEQLGVSDRTRSVEVPERDIVALAESIRTGLAPDRLMSVLEDWRLEPAELRLSRFANQARAMAERLGKEVDVAVVGHGVRLHGATWRSFWSAFTHAVRNAVDHGIETPEERRARGKGERARIDLATEFDGGVLVIGIRDDGRGISWDAVRERGRTAGLRIETESDLANCLFHLGLSTKDEVTEESGRGIGLAVLKRATDEMGGQIQIESSEGRGTALRFRFSAEALDRLGPHRVSSTSKIGPPRRGGVGEQVA